MKAAVLSVLVAAASAETGLDGWLRYAPLPCSQDCQSKLPSTVSILNSTASSPVRTAGEELQNGLKSIYGKSIRIVRGGGNSSSIIVGTLEQYQNAYGSLNGLPDLIPDGFWLSTEGHQVKILGQNERGALYGAYEYLSLLAHGNMSEVAYASNPAAPIRWYARLLSSIKLNAIVVNNVNANATLLTSENIKGLGRIADVFRPRSGGLDTFDPLDPSVERWWSNMTDQVYQHVPDLAGYLIKADSEGEPGPQSYNRTLAQGANVFARAVQPYGGVVMFRAFVYNQLNESNWDADRAKAAVNFFKPLDGKFDDNVVVQIKYGPIDFQVREPTSPLFANLFNTSTAIELEVTQEYLGQQSHVVYLPPLWKTVLDFDLRIDHQPSVVSDIISGDRFNRPLGGYAAVVNVGTNMTWLGSHLSMSNFYAYGRLAWNPADDPQDILQDWVRLTFGMDQSVLETVIKISMESWPAYENYSGNLGIQTLTDILYTHYGPNPASQDNNGWGQWTRADHLTIGMDRTVSNGTGYTSQYPDEIAAKYENVETTPDHLLLWFHHVNYTHRLHSGKTVIQHFYDAHYDGAESAQDFLDQWNSLKGKVDSERFSHIRRRLEYQAGHSIIWRDAINGFYYNLSGIPDARKRVGNHPWRIEAEDMDLDGYKTYDVSPFETASGAVAIVTASNDTAGVATTTLDFESGTYDLAVNYYDLYGGRSHWKVSLNDQSVGEWVGNNEDYLSHTPSVYLDGHSATRIKFQDVEIRKGDVLKVVGSPNGVEPAPLDYISFLPRGVVD
ncbi:hypothetical protein N7468_008078 [Penicillium chermesinum]|uniref:Alpha-glucuronidase n=1 Tax=Penicillium chermesinum TaxID=63820 RepID=A0A9W9TI14_9EURO|nr:uncharacterized protein N7468_008078 [Penicillium chermesinum]KAJ5223536.1 hypothetical protein N7468_008078 [Penicillium chermesinum]